MSTQPTAHVTTIEQIDPTTVVDFYNRLDADTSALAEHTCYTFTLDTDPGQSYALIAHDSGQIAIITNADPGWWELRGVPAGLEAVRTTIETALFTDDLERAY